MFEEMVAQVVSLLNKDTLKDIKKEFVNTPKERLVKFHGTLGRTIRNEFKLWETEWKPEIREGIDYSQNHPDQLSLRVMEEVWVRLNK